MNTACDVAQPDVQIKPRYCIVKVDETANWTPDIVARAGKVFSVYLIDTNSPVCGESTPEYECFFVESQFDNPTLTDREADWLAVEIGERDDNGDPVRYFPCAQIDSLDRIEEGGLSEGVIDLRIDNEEDALDYLRLRSV